MSDIASRVKKIIIDKLGVDESEVTNEASLLTTSAPIH
jgi:acyl carrier protein